MWCDFNTKVDLYFLFPNELENSESYVVFLYVIQMMKNQKRLLYQDLTIFDSIFELPDTRRDTDSRYHK